MTSFYQISQDYQRLLPQLFNPETGEVDQDIEAQLAALSESGKEKAIALVGYMQSLDAEVREIEHIKNQIKVREEAYNRERQRMEAYLVYCLKANKIKEIKCPLFSIKLKQNPWSTEVWDESQIPDKFMREREIKKIERKPDKDAIKKYVLESGEIVPGAKVLQKDKLVISIDKL